MAWFGCGRLVRKALRLRAHAAMCALRNCWPYSSRLRQCLWNKPRRQKGCLLTDAKQQQTLVILLRPVLLYLSHD